MVCCDVMMYLSSNAGGIKLSPISVARWSTAPLQLSIGFLLLVYFRDHDDDDDHGTCICLCCTFTH